jgi:hypothetical protein
VPLSNSMPPPDPASPPLPLELELAPAPVPPCPAEPLLLPVEFSFPAEHDATAPAAMSPVQESQPQM